MGLVAFQGVRVGFWLAERSQDPAGELPPGLVAEETNVRTADTRALVLVGVDAGDVPRWGRLLHARAGAALVCPFGPWLLAGLGETALFLNPEGGADARYEASGDELTGAWQVPAGLLLLGRRGAHLLDDRARLRWVAPLAGDAFQLLEADAGTLVLAAMAGDDWREVRLDARSGRPLDDSELLA